MSWKQDKTLVKILGSSLPAISIVAFYGPFNKSGKFTSPSNEEFDSFLKSRDSSMGIRTIEDIANNMAKHGLFFKEDIEMPANNRILVFEN